MRAKSGWLSAPNMSRHRDICSRCTMTQPPSDVVKIKCSQILQDDPAVATLVHRTSVQRAGMDAVWRAGNQNPLLRRVLTSLTAVI